MCLREKPSDVSIAMTALYVDDGVERRIGEGQIVAVGFGKGEDRRVIQRRQALRDGDRFFYLADPVLRSIERDYGITYRHRLGEVIELNTDADVAADVFHVPPA